jgi:hypothetical protein
VGDAGLVTDSEQTDPDLCPTLPTFAAGVLRAAGVLCLVIGFSVAALVAFRESTLDTGDRVVVGTVAALASVLLAAMFVAFGRLVTLAERADTQRLAMLDQLRRLPD